jgi:hypothetical protein
MDPNAQLNRTIILKINARKLGTMYHNVPNFQTARVEHCSTKDKMLFLAVVTHEAQLLLGVAVGLGVGYVGGFMDVSLYFFLLVMGIAI